MQVFDNLMIDVVAAFFRRVASVPIHCTGSVELTWEEIRHVCAEFDLDIIREERRDAIYNANQQGLMRTVYNGVFCSAVKRSKAKVNGT